VNPDRPSPEPDAVSSAFFTALGEGRLCLQSCAECGTPQFGQLFCVRCSSRSLRWVPASGRGTVYAVTRLHLAYHPAFAESVPYSAVTVELEEGPRLYANLVADGGAAVEAEIGMAVEVRFSALASGVTIPVFAPAA
jgi:uncharacterized OB-fold protein